ncbi:MAG: L,D-transpeptidase, partial [Aggregatilineales bacterium]
RQVDGALQIYNAPNGTPLRQIDPGFNFVTLNSGDAGGWTEINPGEWVPTEKLIDTTGNISSFTGYLLPEEPLQYTIAWSLVNMYPSPEPGGSPLESLEYIYRYTPLRVYTEVEVDGYRWYQIDAGKWVHQHRVSKVNAVSEIPEGIETDLWVGIDLFEQNVVVYEGARPIFATLTSTGLPRWPTFEGVYNIYYRTQREHMTWGVVGDDYYVLEEVPWTMFFDEGRALHGAYWHDGFGYRRSHGCVNLSITDAKWLYDRVADYMGSSRSGNLEDDGVGVYVYSSDTYDS